MRNFLVIFYFISFISATAQQPEIARYSVKSNLNFFTDTTDKKPSHVIKPSFHWGSRYYKSSWLDPILLEFEASRLYDIQFIILIKTHNWLKLQTAPKKEFWVKSDSPLIIRNFATFFSEIKRIELVDSFALSSNANLTDTVKTKDFRCFEPLEILENKMHIRSVKNFICENENNFKQVTGWVIWNDPKHKFVNLRSY